jgi:hypothetical protein
MSNSRADWSGAVARFFQRVGDALAPFMDAAGRYMLALTDLARIFRASLPLGARGWALSTYGLLIAPEGHAKAASLAASDVGAAETELERAWSDPAAQQAVCDLVPYVYPPEQRGLAERRRELFERARARAQEGLYEESLLLLYSQLDGIFQDVADRRGESGFARLFSRRPVGPGQEFRDLVLASGTMSATEEEFFLIIRDRLTESVTETTLEDHPSRHGVLHGRVLGFGHRHRTAQTFAFAAAALELLIALEETPYITRREAHASMSEIPPALRFIAFARLLPVRTVYLTGRDSEPRLLMADDRPSDLRWLTQSLSIGPVRGQAEKSASPDDN